VVRILFLLVVLGLVWWLIGFLPLPEPFPVLIRVVIVLCLIWELLALAGYTKSVIGRSPPP
jgi:hypothetical protein